MLRQCAPMEYVDYTVRRLEKGVLLVSNQEGKNPNVMTISWGFIGFQWSKPVFIVPVRTERFSHPLIAKSGEFVVSIQPPTMDDDANYCGTRSGKDTDKWVERGFVPVQLPGIATPGIEQANLHYACRVIHTASAEPLTSHTFFFGEIVGAYVDAAKNLSL